MKNFIYVFILLLSVNLLVPSVYHYIYSETGDTLYPSDGETPSQTSVSDNNSSENTKFTLYNLETGTTDEIELIPFLIGSAACEMPASY